MGRAKFLSLYLVAGVFGGLIQCMLTWAGINEVVKMVDGEMVKVVVGVVGASAGIFGLMAAFAVMYWNRELTLLIMFILPVRMKAKFILIALAVIGVLGIISNDSGIAHGAHLGGMVWGVLFILLFVQGGTMSGAPPLWNRIQERQSSSRSRRRKAVATEGDVRAYSKGDQSFNDPEEDIIIDKIDPILDKISAQGFSSLTDEERKRMAAIHPMFMGGEYLPEYVKDETEIARIELRSTLADVISIRARTEEGIITYSVVDEYDESEFELPIDMSVEPFSLQQLIEFIDGVRFNGSTGIATCHNESNAEHMDREGLADFTTVNSDIYPELEAHYGQVFKEWAREGEEAVA